MENKDYEKEYKLVRQKFWINIYVAYVGAANATNPNGAERWADIALKEYDRRFPKGE